MAVISSFFDHLLPVSWFLWPNIYENYKKWQKEFLPYWFISKGSFSSAWFFPILWRNLQGRLTLEHFLLPITVFFLIYTMCRLGSLKSTLLPIIDFSLIFFKNVQARLTLEDWYSSWDCLLKTTVCTITSTLFDSFKTNTWDLCFYFRLFWPISRRFLFDQKWAVDLTQGIRIKVVKTSVGRNTTPGVL